MLILGMLGATSVVLTLIVSYYLAKSDISQGALKNAETLSDQIAYSLEILASQGDIFAMQRVTEKTSTLEGVSRIIIVDNHQIIKAHSEKRMVGQKDESPLFAEAIHERRIVNQVSEMRIIFVRPLRGQAYTSEYQDVIGALWVEIDISNSVRQTRNSFLWVAVIGGVTSLMAFGTQYIILKKNVVDRIFDIERGIKNALRGELGTAIVINTSFGSEDEINALAQSYNYLSATLKDSQTKLQSERDFALHIMENMGEGLTIANAEGNFEYVNPAYARFLQRSPDEIIGHLPEDFTNHEDRAKLTEGWNLRMKGKSSSYETSLIAKDGSFVTVIVTAVPRFNNGKFAGNIAVVTNVSERARFEQMKTDFVNRASHELRTPLTTAILMADLLEGGGTDEEREEFITILKQELNRQLILLNDLLVAGRIESRKYEVHASRIDIPPVINEAVAAIKLQAESRQIQLVTDLDKSLPLVNTDRQSLFQILLNLLSNGIKYSRINSEVMIKAKMEGQFVRVAVLDKGIGIPAQDLPHITTRFFRAQNATKREVQGTGIGLYIVKEILDALGGHMEIASAENQGTTVSIYLPTK